MEEAVTLFQSTLPARGATHQFFASLCGIFYFNPRSPHGERRLPEYWYYSVYDISIHAPRTGSDTARLCIKTVYNISIHAPRTGSDILQDIVDVSQEDFNPRSPHGERRHPLPRENRTIAISIHAPRTGSDVYLRLPNGEVKISIHAPRTGSDQVYNSTFR